jgi:hypothetical protein
MISLIHKIPILTTLFSAWFFLILYRHYRQNPKPHIAWWCFGVLAYGAGTLTESYVGLFGWNEVVFKGWYITGALLGGFPLAQGTAYLLFNRKTANVFTVLFSALIVITSVFVILSPIHYDLVEPTRLTGKVLVWNKIRLVTPFINIYAFIVLVGGALYSAWLYYKKGKEFKPLYQGNILIALGGLLPGIGGSFTKFGYTEVLYVTELIGILLIYAGYRIVRTHKWKKTVSAVSSVSAVVQ